MDQTLVSMVAPQRVQRGYGVLALLGEWVKTLGLKPLVIGGRHTNAQFGPAVEASLEAAGLEGHFADYGLDCTEASLERLRALAADFDVVIGVGGGKALDMAKLVADHERLPVITVPTSAATCAAWAALSNIYSEAGTWLYGVELESAPQGLLLDYALIKMAPARTLASGLGDALAKWYEASISSAESDDPLVIAAVQQARVLRDLVLQRGEEALQMPGSRAWEQMVDASICLAGVVGGLGGSRCRTVAAHAVHNGLTSLAATRRTLHGEKVAFGILVQLRLEETVGRARLASIARDQLEQFYRRIGLPLTLCDLDLGSVSEAELRTVAELCCRPGSDLHYLPFSVTSEELFLALQDSTAARLVVRPSQLS